MLLSEAIRLGATLRPQGFGGYLKDGGTCALGAACEAVGVDVEGLSVLPGAFSFGKYVHEKFPFVYTDGPACPECVRVVDTDKRFNRNVGQLIVHLNDQHRWTREQIADFVATLEPKPSEQPKPELEEVSA